MTTKALTAKAQRDEWRATSGEAARALLEVE